MKLKYIFLKGDSLQCNSYILYNNLNQSVLFDAGVDVDELKNQLGNLTLTGIAITHGHFDHIKNLEQILNEFGLEIPVYLAKEAKDKLFDSNKNLSYLFGASFEMDKTKKYNFKLLKDMQEIVLLGVKFKVYNFLGHSSCSLAFLGSGYFIVGDVVFKSGIGRSDFEENGLNDTISSLKRFLTLSGYDIVLSGHGEVSTFERQQKNISLHLKFLERDR